jgi:HEAT repeat protein
VVYRASSKNYGQNWSVENISLFWCINLGHNQSVIYGYACVSEITVESLLALASIAPDSGEVVTVPVSALINPIRGSRVMIPALWAIQRMGPAAVEAVPSVAAVLQHYGMEEVRRAAGDTLAAIGSAAVPALSVALRLGERDVDWISSEALARIGPAAVQALIAAFRECKEADVRKKFASVLGQIGPAAIDAIPVLVSAVEGSSEDVRKILTENLKRIQPNAD